MPLQIINSSLRKAATQNDLETVQRLVASGANIYDMDEEGRTAFNCAASNGLESLAWLTEIAFEDTQKVKSDRHWPEYDLNTPFGYYGSTLITYAAKVCSVSLVRRMLVAGADITIINSSGWTLLHCAAVMPARIEVIQELVQAFKNQSLDALINAVSTQTYQTEYSGHPVIYASGLTAAGLCHARIAQDPACPSELNQYFI